VLPGAAVVFQQLARILGQGYLQHAKTIERVTSQYATTYGKGPGLRRRGLLGRE